MILKGPSGSKEGKSLWENNIVARICFRLHYDCRRGSQTSLSSMSFENPIIGFFIRSFSAGEDKFATRVPELCPKFLDVERTVSVRNALHKLAATVVQKSQKALMFAAHSSALASISDCVKPPHILRLPKKIFAPFANR